MRGSVFKRGAGYVVKVELPADPATGKRRQKWYHGFATRKEAERARVALLGKLDRGDYQEPTKETVAQFLRSWLTGTAARIRPSTLVSYQLIVTRRVIPHIGAIPIQSVRAADLNDLYAALLATGSSSSGPLSPKTVRNVHIVLHRAFEDAVRRGLIARNPADHTDVPRVEQQPMNTWSREELRAFLGSVKDDPMYAAWLLAATTGMRRGEVLGLRWTDVDIDRGRASVSQQITTVRNKPVAAPPKTAKARRAVALDKRTILALEKHRRGQAAQQKLAGASWVNTGLVFTRPDGNLIHPDLFSRWFTQRCRAAELRRIRLHDLRHGWATMALEAGVHPKIVSEQLGHATTGITLDIYSHVAPSMSADAVERVASALFDE